MVSNMNNMKMPNKLTNRRIKKIDKKNLGVEILFDMTVQFAKTKKVPVSAKELETGIKEMRRVRAYFNKMLAFAEAKTLDAKHIKAINESIIEVSEVITQAKKLIRKNG